MKIKECGLFYDFNEQFCLKELISSDIISIIIVNRLEQFQLPLVFLHVTINSPGKRFKMIIC